MGVGSNTNYLSPYTECKFIWAGDANLHMGSRNIIWITVESLRQDHTSLGDYKRNTTPNLLELSNSGVYFENCFSHSIWTRASSASILSGFAPSAHQTWTNESKLPRDISTIPEAFRDAGYQTVCISPNPHLSPNTGLDRGFEDFHYISRSSLFDEVPSLSLLKWALRIRDHGGGFTLDGRKHCLGYVCNEIAKRHIDETVAENNSLFLYIHHEDTHHPYVPPKKWLGHFDDSSMSNEQAIELTLDTSRNLHKVIGKETPFSNREWRALEELYDTTVAYVDYLVGDIISYARKMMGDPIIVVTGDHGEFFDERGLLAHMLAIHSAVSNVPLVASGLDDLPSGGLVQHADIMKILCTELGIDHKVPVGQDLRESPRPFAITQRAGHRARHKLKEITRHNDEFDAGQFHQSDLTSIRTENWRYQTSDDGENLYSLQAEGDDVSEDHPDEVERLRETVSDWLERYGDPVGKTGTVEFSDEMEKQLSELGYLQ